MCWLTQCPRLRFAGVVLDVAVGFACVVRRAVYSPELSLLSKLDPALFPTTHLAGRRGPRHPSRALPVLCVCWPCSPGLALTFMPPQTEQLHGAEHFLPAHPEAQAPAAEAAHAAGGPCRWQPGAGRGLPFCSPCLRPLTRVPPQASSFSSITDSTMSLNIITVTLNMGEASLGSPTGRGPLGEAQPLSRHRSPHPCREAPLPGHQHRGAEQRAGGRRHLHRLHHEGRGCGG